jgi:hypothetical protein
MKTLFNKLIYPFLWLYDCLKLFFGKKEKHDNVEAIGWRLKSLGRRTKQ